MAGSGPLELIDAATQAGFNHIGMRIVPPTADTRMVSPLGDAALRAAIGATRPIVILGDPIAQVKAPAGLTRELNRRGRDAIVVPIRVKARGYRSRARGNRPHGQC